MSRDTGSNGYGEFETTLDATFRAYDRLPAQLRRAIQMAVSPFATEPIEGHLRQGIAEKTIIRAMAARDRAETLKAYGPHHPEARAHV